jgi:hypothetical protein
VLHLTTFRAAQADDSSHLATINKSHEVQRVRLRREREHTQLFIPKPIITPNQRGIPIELSRQSQRDAMLGDVGLVFGGIELDEYYLM